MELRHLRYFVQLAEELHFARAAERLGIAQPPLSQQIQRLEAELGVRLLERTSRRVALTPAGAAFLEEARRTLRQADRAVAVARRAARGEAGDLAIGFNASAPLVPQVASAIHRFRRTYPDVALELAEVTPAEQVTALLDRSLDIGFMRSSAPPALPPLLHATLLVREGLQVAMRRDHPLAARGSLALADLGKEAIVVYAADRGGFTGEILAMLRGAGIEPRIGQSVRELSTLVGLVAAGVGIAIVAESLRALQSPELVYLPLSDRVTASAIWVVHHGSAASLTGQHFLAFLDRPPDP